MTYQLAFEEFIETIERMNGENKNMPVGPGLELARSQAMRYYQAVGGWNQTKYDSEEKRLKQRSDLLVAEKCGFKDAILGKKAIAPKSYDNGRRRQYFKSYKSVRKQMVKNTTLITTGEVEMLASLVRRMETRSITDRPIF